LQRWDGRAAAAHVMGVSCMKSRRGIDIEIPSNLEHLEFINNIAAHAESQSLSYAEDLDDELVLLGNSMHAIYLSATCVENCVGGSHQIEYIGARVYNLSAASYKLITSGFYDEAQSLIRSVGEISNLVSLAVHDHTSFEEWVDSDKQTRIKKFSPAKVRMLVEKAGGILLMNQELYSELCEEYTHLIPKVRPNNYDHDRNVCGGLAQKNGFEQSITLLGNLVFMLALFFCRHSGLENEFNKLEKLGVHEKNN